MHNHYFVTPQISLVLVSPWNISALDEEQIRIVRPEEWAHPNTWTDWLTPESRQSAGPSNGRLAGRQSVTVSAKSSQFALEAQWRPSRDTLKACLSGSLSAYITTEQLRVCSLQCWQAAKHGNHCAVNSATAERWNGWMQTGASHCVGDELSSLQVLVQDVVTVFGLVVMSW